MIRKYVLPLFAVFGLAAAIAMVEEGSRTPPIAAPAFQPAEAPFSSYIFGPGIVEASTQNIAIGTPASGIVTAIYVTWGEHVQAGRPLFKVDTRDLDAQLLPANANVDQVEAQLLPATAKVTEAQETLAKAGNLVKVGQGLEPGVSISAEDLANRQFDVGIDKAILGSAKAQVDQIKTQIAVARAQVQQIRDEIQLRTIRAPVSGSILQMNTGLGEYAQAGVLSTPLMVVGNDTVLYVRIDVDQSDAWRFHPGAPAIAYVRGNASLKTRVRYVRTDPDVVPQPLLTGDATQRTDTRVLQVIYSFDRSSLPTYVGQLMDVFIEALPAAADTNGRTQQSSRARDDDARGHGNAAADTERRP
ncbi:MAG TPA: HlyD family efflux transporter periplasmic adaptor subunit [Candidatus Acidoferrales bacterium]|nr:HlyD family efflux transporter periplasmic adaptor subunit [Candidatus Acidoferrales bacterium]